MRAAWLEPHDQFEGVGAHEMNPRYDHVDGDDSEDNFEHDMRSGLKMAPVKFLRAQTMTPALTPIRLDGADLAHYQFDAGPIDWDAYVRACWFGMTKLTQSIGYLDPTSARIRQSMRVVAVGVRGVYHWLSSTTDPEQQAWWFLKNFGEGEHEFAALDDEEHGVNVDKTLGWLEPVEAKLKRPSPVYSGAFVAGGTIWTDPRVRESKYGLRPMMLAAYTTETKALALPGVAAHPWSSWQFSSSGPVPGITGRCDMNRVDARAAFELAAGLGHPSPTFPPVHQEDDMKLLTNGEPRDMADGHGLWEAGKVMFKLVEGPGPEDDVAVHLPDTPKGRASAAARGVPQPMSNVDLDALTT